MGKFKVILIATVLFTAVTAEATGQMTYFATCGSGYDTLYVLREGVDNPIAQFDLPSETTGLTFDGENWWMIKQPEGTIYCFDYGGDYVTDFPAPTPYPEALAWDGEYLWITCYSDSSFRDLRVYQRTIDGLPGPYNDFAVDDSAGLTIFDNDVVVLVEADLHAVCYAKNGTFKRYVDFGYFYSDRGYSITTDGERLWVCLFDWSDFYVIADFDPYTGEWLGHYLHPYGMGTEYNGLAAGVWSYTGVEAESFGKIKAYFK
jgi:hypothetical protein